MERKEKIIFTCVFRENNNCEPHSSPRTCLSGIIILELVSIMSLIFRFKWHVTLYNTCLLRLPVGRNVPGPEIEASKFSKILFQSIFLKTDNLDFLEQT
jgi:hypothetical protein